MGKSCGDYLWWKNYSSRINCRVIHRLWIGVDKNKLPRSKPRESKPSLKIGRIFFLANLLIKESNKRDMP